MEVKKAIHVKEYTRKKHGRAKFGGKVSSHNKSGRAVADDFGAELKDGKTHYYGAIVDPSTRTIDLIDGWHEFKPATESYGSMFGVVCKWFTSVADRAKFLKYAQSGDMGVRYRIDTPVEKIDTIHIPTAYSGRAYNYTKKELKDMVSEIKEEVEGDPSVWWFGSDVDTVEKEFLADKGFDKKYHPLIKAGANELRKQYQEEWDRQAKDESCSGRATKASPGGQMARTSFVSKSTPYIHEQMDLFIKDYTRKWGVKPSQRELISKRLDLEKEKKEREELAQRHLSQEQEPIPEQTEQTVGSRYNTNIHIGGGPGGRRGLTPPRTKRSFYAKKVLRGD